MRLKNKKALITGASSGIGAATAKLFAKEGAKVFITDVNVNDGNSVVEEIISKGGRAIFLEHDVRSENDWKKVMENILDAEGQLDILVNNAGYSGSTTEDSMDLKAFETLMDINIKGVFLGLKAVVPAMRESGGGSIINISSVSGNVGQHKVHIGYNGSKGAVRLMTKSSAVQNGDAGIRVNSVHPGIMPLMKSVTISQAPAAQESIKARIPLGRPGKPIEVGYAILFLASEESSYITGSEIHVDGGYLAG